MPHVDIPALVILLTASAFIVAAAGVVKGVMGVGMGLLAIPMLSLIMPASQAIGLLVMPVLLSNLWQALENGSLHYSWLRFRILIVAQFVATVLTVRYTKDFSIQEMNAMLAMAVLCAVLLMAVRPRGQIHPRYVGCASALVGVTAGFMGGISSLIGPVLITYLMALHLK